MNRTITVTDFSKIKGQEHVKRAIEISVAGKHNLLLIGTKGSGLTTMVDSVASFMGNTAFVNPLTSREELLRAVKNDSNILVDDLYNYSASILKLLKYTINECYIVAATPLSE